MRLLREFVVAGRYATGYLHVDDSGRHAVSPQQLPTDKADSLARARQRDPKLSQRILQPVQMRLFIDQPPADDRHDLVHAVGQLITAILDMDAGIDVCDIAS